MTMTLAERGVVRAGELPLVVAVTPGSVAERIGLQPGDEIARVNGRVPRDIIEWQLQVDEADLLLEVQRGGLELELDVAKRAGEPLGAEIASAVFDRVRTCDNHCEFCFIYQLPKGMRRSLYLKDDDYRLSFLYGNFTTLTRFTEADLERVVTQRLSPLHVSIHATDPRVRERMLRNKRGGMSLRWLRALLDHGIEVHGQVVVCPGLNDGDVLDDTLAGVLDRFPDLASVAVVPLGVSRFNAEPAMRPHTLDEARTVVDIIERWQATFLAVLGHPMVHAADEYFLLADRPFPPAAIYGEFPMHEDGIGMARTFEREFRGEVTAPTGPQAGFFAAVDGAPAAGYRAPRTEAGCGADRAAVGVTMRARATAPVGVLTGRYGAEVLAPLVDELDRDDVRLLPVANEFFGGNTAVTGLMVGADVARVLDGEPAGHRYLLPDVCLTGGVFLDGMRVDDLPRPVEVIATNGIALRAALEPGAGARHQRGSITPQIREGDA
jgi:putative radical SAM enzyme (TIGR03279 family)